MSNSMPPRDFEDDPFFSDPFCAHREHMRQMMRSFSEPFGGSLMPSITDGRHHSRDMAEHSSGPNSLGNEHRDMSRSLVPFGSTDGTNMMRNPFRMFDNMMSNMRNTMDEMNTNFENTSTDSNSHSFSSSSVMTYSKVGDEAPKVFQASSSTRRAPGGIKEIRHAVKDTESGVEKMRIGHHINDKGHVVEKKYNKKTGEKEMNQDFQNLDESEAQSFDAEWEQKLSNFRSCSPISSLKEPRRRGVHQAAIAAPEPHRDKQKSQAKGKRRTKGSEQ